MRSKVKEAADELGLSVELRTLGEPTATVAQAAAALGVEEGQIAKSIVFVMDGEPVVVVASGRHRIDQTKVCDASTAPRGARHRPTRGAPRQASRAEACRRSGTACPWCSTPPCSTTTSSTRRVATGTPSSRSRRANSPEQCTRWLRPSANEDRWHLGALVPDRAGGPRRPDHADQLP